MRTPALILTVLLAAGCSSGGGATQPTASSPTTTTVPGAGLCTEVARVGATTTDALIDKGCADENGTLRLGKVKTCKNGQRLWRMDRLIGLSGWVIAEDDMQIEGVRADTVLELRCLSTSAPSSTR